MSRIKLKIKKNDQVLVIAGKDRGARGKVLRVLRAKNMALVERVNMVKRHTRPNPQKGIQGGILEKEAPLHVSNLMVIDPQKDKQNEDTAKLIGLVTNLFTSTAATLSEVADTRAWTTLPGHIEGALIDLPPGNYSLVLDTAAGPVECGGVTVQADRLVVVPIRTFPEPLPARD